jgi:hypothetical protein
VVSVIAFLISGIGLLALIFALVALCNKSKCLAIAAIVIGSICIVIAIVFWIILIVLLVRKASLENTYCPSIKTACCSGSYISSSIALLYFKFDYNKFTCQSSSSTCSANPFTYIVMGTCSGSLSSTPYTYYSYSYTNYYSLTYSPTTVSCSGTSSCNGYAYDPSSSLCSDCTQNLDCGSYSIVQYTRTYCK